MATITFDILKFVTRLKDSGLSESQAVAITEAFETIGDGCRLF